MTSPTRFSLLLMRELDFIAEVTEHFNPHVGPEVWKKGRHGKPELRPAGVRQDLFGIIDVLAIRARRTVGVQATTTGNIRSRISKALNEPNLGVWLAAGNSFEVHGWEVTKPRGVKLRIHDLTDGDDGGRIIRFATQKLPDAVRLMSDDGEFELVRGAVRMPERDVQRLGVEDEGRPF